MEINPSFIEALFYLSLIVFAPVFFKLSRLTTKYLMNRYFFGGEIVVIHKRGGIVVRTQKIKTTGYVVDQLSSLKGGANG